MELGIIKQIVEMETGQDLMKKKHQREVVDAKAIFCKIAVDKTGHTMKEIARFIHPKADHSFVIHKIKTFDDAYTMVPYFRRWYDSCIQTIERFEDTGSLLSWSALLDALHKVTLQNEQLKRVIKELEEHGVQQGGQGDCSVHHSED